MQIEVVRPGELGAGEVAAWHVMQRGTPLLGNPFLAPEFVVAVGAVRPGVRVAVLHDGPRVAGFFPFERRRLGVGVPVAAELTDCQGLVHAPGLVWDPRGLLRACRISVWGFDHLVAGQGAFDGYRSAVAPSPVIDLAGGFGLYAGRLRAAAPRFWAGLARRTRNLGRDAGEVRFDADSADGGALGLLMAWKSAQYRRTGRPDRFAQRWVVELVESLAAVRGGPFAGMLSVLYAGGRPVAVGFNPRFDQVLAGWFMAYDPAFSRHSPGVIALLRLAESCAGSGVGLIDMGKGARWYKDKLKTGEHLVGEGIITRRSPAAAAHRARLSASQWAVRTIRAHPPLFTAADRLLRSYGRIRRPRADVPGRAGAASRAAAPRTGPSSWASSARTGVS